MDPAVASIIVAAITAGTAAFAGIRANQAKRVSQETNTRFQGNGRGDVTAMLEYLVDWTKLHGVRHTAIDAIIHDLRHPEDAE